jgi:hypothetical protein
MTRALKRSVKPLPSRAQGTVTLKTPCFGQCLRGTRASKRHSYWKKFRCLHRFVLVSWVGKACRTADIQSVCPHPRGQAMFDTVGGETLKAPFAFSNNPSAHHRTLALALQCCPGVARDARRIYLTTTRHQKATLELKSRSFFVALGQPSHRREGDLLDEVVDRPVPSLVQRDIILYKEESSAGDGDRICAMAFTVILD